jgi:hypothetical protein
MWGVLWGPGRDLDYWSAVAAAEVNEPEARAVALLATTCDEARFSRYCLTGTLPALGNATKRTYLIRRHYTTLEMDDGRPVVSWCVMARDRHLVPETDHVVAMMSLIEGEEMAFRGLGNRLWVDDGVGEREPGGRGPGVPALFEAPIAPRMGAGAGDVGGQEAALRMAEFQATRQADLARIRAELTWARPPAEPDGAEVAASPTAVRLIDEYVRRFMAALRPQAQVAPILAPDGAGWWPVA